jgi:hypothetical protein
VIDFLNKANTILTEERERAHKYYPVQTFREDIWKVLTKELIEKPGNELISRQDGGLLSMLRENHKKYAKILYSFITEIRFDLSKFIAEISEFIKERILQIKAADVKDAGEESNHLIKELINFRTYLLEVVRDCFMNNHEIK